MSQPTIYDLIQDGRLDALEGAVSPAYTPPEGPEVSFPVVGQGIDSEQYRQMSLAQGNGIIHRGHTPYYLVKHPTDAETNAKNTLILKVDSQTGISESIIGGFYHRLTGDMEIEFPPVTVATDYYVCVTYDPRKEDDPNGPVSIERYAGPPPRTYDRQHNILNVVKRQPNQLLSDAQIIRYRQAVSPTISVQNAGQLPNPSDVLYGTIAAILTPGDNPSLYISQGSQWWALNDGVTGEWMNLSMSASLSTWGGSANRPRCRKVPMGVQLMGSFKTTNPTGGYLTLPSRFRYSQVMRVPTTISTSYSSHTLDIETNGRIYLRLGANPPSTINRVTLDGIILPDPH